MLTFVDNRHQPPIPINNSLGELLEMVRDAQDPWLLFLYVVSFMFERISTHFQKSSASIAHVTTRGSNRKCSSFHRWLQMELVCVDFVGKLHQGWWRGTSKMILYHSCFSPFCPAIIFASIISIASRSSSCTTFPNQNSERTSQPFREWITVVWSSSWSRVLSQ